MKTKQATTFVICVLSMFLIFFILCSAKVSINAAATVGGSIGLSILPPTPKTVCGNGICETGETCPADCIPKEELRESIAQIKFSHMLLIILVMALCVLAYLYFKEDRPPITGYWQYGYQKNY